MQRNEYFKFMSSQELANLIKEKRNLLKISQKELGERCDTSDSFICNVEKGKREFNDVKYLIKLANALSLPIYVMLEMLGYEEKTEADKTPLIKGLEKLNPSDLKYVQCFVNGIIAQHELKESESKV